MRRVQLVTATGALRAWVSVALLLAGLGGLVFFDIAYQTRGQRKICGIVVLLDDRNQRLPPADPETMAFRRELHLFRKSIDC